MANRSNNPSPQDSAIDARSFKPSRERTVGLALMYFLLGVLAVVTAMFARHWHHDRAFQYMNDYSFLMTLMIGTMFGGVIGVMMAPLFPLAMRGISAKAVVVGMLGAIVGAALFAVATGRFPLGPTGLCLVGAAMVLHMRGARTGPDAKLLCPRCGYDTRGIDAGPCPECGIQTPAADTLRQHRRFKSIIVLALLMSEAFVCAILTWMFWNSPFGFD